MSVKIVARGTCVGLLWAAIAGCGNSSHLGGGTAGTSGAGGDVATGQAGTTGGGGTGTAGTTGAAGTTGTAGAGADAGDGGTDVGDAGAMACGTHPDRVAATWFGGFWPSGATSVPANYDGPAVVESSSGTGVTISFTPSTSMPAMRIGINGQSPLPAFPAGAKVWLSQTPAAQAPYPNAATAGPQPWAFSVRDRQGGRLMLGAAWNISDLKFAPVAFSNPVSYCTAVKNDDCYSWSAAYQSVQIAGDTPVTVRDGETATVKLDGHDYEVYVTAQSLHFEDMYKYCPDYFRAAGVALKVQATDLAALVAALEVGPPPPP